MRDPTDLRPYFWMLARLWFGPRPIVQERSELEEAVAQAMDEDGPPSELTPEELERYRKVRHRY